MHSIDISEQSGVRSLHFGSDWIQGAMRIARPWALELAYTREMMACLLFGRTSPWPRNALLIGLGAGSLCKFIYRHLPECQIDVVEIHPGVLAAARQFFKLPDDPGRLNVFIDDGADFVKTCEQSYDLIMIDGFGPDARPGRLDLSDFYVACRERLGNDGLIVTNLLGRSRGFRASAARIEESFVRRTIVFPSCDSGNAICFAATGELIDISLDEMRNTAHEVKARMGLDLLPTITRLQLASSFPGNRFRL